jgi:murein DD-endopeptidase MepM/ murein hydrolase activator NlpD/lysophospholipase L1-like esterase
MKHINLKLISVLVFSIYLMSVVFVLPKTVLALSKVQKQVIDGNSLRFDVDNCEASKDDGSDNSSKKIYVLGDSLTVGMKDQGNLENALTNSGFSDIKIQATNGYNIADSLPKVDEDSDFLTDTNIVVVALGTNPEADFGSKIPTLINKLKEKAPDAQIYWMNVHVKSGAYIDPSFLGNSEINALIDRKAGDLGYEVINWEGEVTGQPDKYPYLGDGVHHSEEGNIARAQWLADQLGGSTDAAKNSDEEAKGCQCSGAGGTGTLIGTDNEEKIWNYLSSGKGINAIQTAGIMGNMFAESGYDPTSIEPPPGTGRGLVQWSFGRRPPMEAAASAAGVDLTINDDANLLFQLDYMINESKGRTSRSFPEVNEWDGLARTTNIDSSDHTVGSTLYWEWNFERSSGAHNSKRVEAALAVFAKFGSGAGGGVATTSSSGGCSTTSEVCEGATSLPIPESTVITFFNAHNHHRSISYPGGSARHRPILSSSNGFGAESVSGSSAEKGEAADVGAASGTTVLAPLTGKVIYSGHIHRGESDQMIIIESEDKKCVAALAHVQSTVSEGDSVTAADQIGELSNISNSHVHFELWVDSKPVNIGEDDEPCGLGEDPCDNFSDEAEKIWNKQKEALTGAAAGPVNAPESEGSSAD